VGELGVGSWELGEDSKTNGKLALLANTPYELITYYLLLITYYLNYLLLITYYLLLKLPSRLDRKTESQIIPDLDR
jgi:hypothetical protein